MASFPLTAGAHYLKTLNMFRTKSGENVKICEILEQHMPPLIKRMLPKCQQLNILSVGSGDGEIDRFIMKIIKEELQKSDHGRHMKMFNRAIEPNEYSCRLYKAAFESLPEDQQTDFDICQQTFENTKEARKIRKGESGSTSCISFTASTLLIWNKLCFIVLKQSSATEGILSVS